MASRFDVLKSLVHRAAQASRDRVGRLGSVKNVRRALRELRERTVSLGEATLGAAIAQAPGVRASTVTLAEGRVLVDLGYADGESLAMSILPEDVRFAPRGAKEVIFRVEPPEIVGDARARDAVGCLAAAIARGVWGPVLGAPTDAEAALVEREGARLRADLRSVPAVRASLEGSPLSMALEVLTIGEIRVEDRALRITIGLPAGAMP